MGLQAVKPQNKVTNSEQIGNEVVAGLSFKADTVDRFKFEIKNSQVAEPISFNSISLAAKRTFDVLLSAILLLVTAPVLLIGIIIVSFYKGKTAILLD